MAGVRQNLRAIRAGRIERLFVAADAAPATVAGIVEAAVAAGISIDRTHTKAELGRISAVEVDTAVVGVLREPEDGSEGRPLSEE